MKVTPIALAVAAVIASGASQGIQPAEARQAPQARCFFNHNSPHAMPRINGLGIRVVIKCVGNMKAVPSSYKVTGCAYYYKGKRFKFIDCERVVIPLIKGAYTARANRVIPLGGICARPPVKAYWYQASITVVPSPNTIGMIDPPDSNRPTRVRCVR